MFSDPEVRNEDRKRAAVPVFLWLAVANRVVFRSGAVASGDGDAGVGIVVSCLAQV